MPTVGRFSGSGSKAATTDLTGLSARELAALADGSVSSAEAVEAHIARLEEVNPDLNALAAGAGGLVRDRNDQADRPSAAARPCACPHGKRL